MTYNSGRKGAHRDDHPDPMTPNNCSLKSSVWGPNFPKKCYSLTPETVTAISLPNLYS